MSRDFDWKETDRLMERLRAKLAEEENGEQSAPTAVDPSIPVQDEATRQLILSKRAARREAARQRREARAAERTAEESVEMPVIEPSDDASQNADVAVGDTLAVAADTENAADAPVDEGAFAEAPAVETPVFEEAAAINAALTVKAADDPPADNASAITETPLKTESGKEKRKRTVREEHKTESVSPEEGAEPAAEPQRRKSYRGAAIPTSNRNTLFASAYRRDENDYTLHVAEPVKKSNGRKATHVALPDADAIDVSTVEDLWQDLFGTTENPFEDLPAKEPQMPMETVEPIFAPEPEPVPTTAPVDAEPVAADEADAEADPAAAIREINGQMSLVLPEADVTPSPEPEPEPEAVHHSRKRSEELILTDDGQINVFSVLEDAGESDAADADDNGHTARARMELKRAVESSDEDFRLLMGLDYENELGNAIGFEKIREYHEFGLNGEAVQKNRRRKDTDKLEFETQGQDVSLRRGYTKQKRDYVIRLIVSLVLTLLIVLYESTHMFAAMFGGPFDGELYPVSYILFGMQLLILAVFFSRKRLLEGLLRLVRFSPIDYSLCSVMVVGTLVYHVLLLFMSHTTEPDLYLSPAAISIVLLTADDLLNWYRESLAFRVVSSRRLKCALIPRVSVGGKEGDAKARLSESDGMGNVLYARPVGFVRNYFANTEKRVAHSRTLGAQLLLILAIGCAAALFVMATGGSEHSVLRTLFVTFLMSAPTASLLVTSLPMFWAAILRLRQKSAIIGEEPIYKCRSVTTLVLPDTELFAPMHHESFKKVEGCDVRLVTVLVRALLDKLESPLRDSISIDLDSRMSPSLVELTEIDEEGVAAVADGQYKLLMGNMRYMQKHGFNIRHRNASEREDVACQRLYISINRKVSACFDARYRLNDSTRALLDELDAADVQVVVRTKDPGINAALMQYLLPDRSEPLRVMKPTANEMELHTDRVDATVVSLGSGKETARTFITCRRISRARRLGKLFQALSVGVGALIAGMLAMLHGVVDIPSVLVSLYLLLWSGLHATTSYFYLRESKGE